MGTQISILDVPNVDRQAIAAQLKKAGWVDAPEKSADPSFVHPEVKDEQQVRERLRGLGLDPVNFYIEDDVDARMKP